MAHIAEKKGTFLEEVIEATPGGERLIHCLQCGSCGGSCPSSDDMEYTPRTLIAMINAGQRDDSVAVFRDCRRDSVRTTTWPTPLENGPTCDKLFASLRC